MAYFCIKISRKGFRFLQNCIHMLPIEKKLQHQEDRK